MRILVPLLPRLFEGNFSFPLRGTRLCYPPLPELPNPQGGFSCHQCRGGDTPFFAPSAKRHRPCKALNFRLTVSAVSRTPALPASKTYIGKSLLPSCSTSPVPTTLRSTARNAIKGLLPHPSLYPSPPMTLRPL